MSATSGLLTRLLGAVPVSIGVIGLIGLFFADNAPANKMPVALFLSLYVATGIEMIRFRKIAIVGMMTLLIVVGATMAVRWTSTSAKFAVGFAIAALATGVSVREYAKASVRPRWI